MAGSAPTDMSIDMHNLAPNHETNNHAFAELTVLVIDDEDFELEWIGACLRKLHIGTQYLAKSGEEALQIFAREKHAINVIVCDLEMPRMDGMECLRHLAEAGCTASIILFSSFDKSIMRSVELMARADGLTVLGSQQKPISSRSIATLLALYTSARTLRPVAPPSVTDDEMRSGIDAGGFQPYYLPKISLSSGNVCGVEALAYWQHRAHGALPPSAYRPCAESNGMLAQITQQLISAAIHDLSLWHRDGIAISVSINITLRTSDEHNLVTELPARLVPLGLRPEHITFVVTEANAFGDNLRLLETLSRIRLRGFGLSIDDFGNGFSSLLQLQKIPFTELRIDRHYVTGASRAQHQAAIVESNVALGQRLGLSTVAAGVEDVNDWGFVRNSGVTEALGGLIAAPMPADAFLRWCRTWTPPHSNSA